MCIADRKISRKFAEDIAVAKISITKTRRCEIVEGNTCNKRRGIGGRTTFARLWYEKDFSFIS